MGLGFNVSSLPQTSQGQGRGVSSLVFPPKPRVRTIELLTLTVCITFVTPWSCPYLSISLQSLGRSVPEENYSLKPCTVRFNHFLITTPLNDRYTSLFWSLQIEIWNTFYIRSI